MKATVSCSRVTFGSRGSQTPIPHRFKRCVWRRQWTRRGQGTSGLCARMHSPFSQYELQTLCKSEIVGLNYIYNSAFPILSVPKISCSHALARTCTYMSTKSSSRLREVRRHHIPCRICRHRFRMCVPSLNGLDKSSLTNSGM